MKIVYKADPSAQKLRGGYYTPTCIADFLAKWAVQCKTDHVLEPSCGAGELLAAATRRLLDLGAGAAQITQQIRGIELYESEVELARSRLAELNVFCNGSISAGDFFEFDGHEWGIVDRRFDVVLGNPPFLRYQHFPEDQRTRAFRIMQTASLKPTKLTNSWVAFLVASSLRLNDHGRLAMIVPAELLQVKYAAETRAFLAKYFGALTIITFRKLVFEGIQQEVVLLLAEKSPQIESGIDVVQLNDATDLDGYEVKLRERHHLKSIDHGEDKWTQYYLDNDEIALLRSAKRHPDLIRLGDIGQVDVGIVTGNNSFFVLPQSRVSSLKLQSHTLPIVGRTVQLPGLIYSLEDWQKDQKADVACNLLNLPEEPVAILPKAGRAYVKGGEQEGVHEGYKCRIRKYWYSAPSRWAPDAFLFRQIHLYPKMVFNCTGATSTDTIHRVRLNKATQADQITASFHNSLTFAFSETMGRSYGGGVLELEPTEAEHLPLPFFESETFDLNTFDTLARQGKMEAILDITDKQLLQDRLGFSAQEVKMFRNIWRKLSRRRVGRKEKGLT